MTEGSEGQNLTEEPTPQELEAGYRELEAYARERRSRLTAWPIRSLAVLLATGFLAFFFLFRPPAGEPPPGENASGRAAPALPEGKMVLVVPVAVSGRQPEFLQSLEPHPGVKVDLYTYPGLRYQLVTDTGSYEGRVVVTQDGRMQQSFPLAHTVRSLRLELEGYRPAVVRNLPVPENRRVVVPRVVMER